jgi:hypothetical protein
MHHFQEQADAVLALLDPIQTAQEPASACSALLALTPQEMQQGLPSHVLIAHQAHSAT